MEPPTRAVMDPATGVRRIPLRPHDMRDTVTKIEDLFVLAHLGVPRIEATDWRLGIDGLVGRPAAWSLDDLKARPKITIEAVHQCCGNPMEPKVPTNSVKWLSRLHLAADRSDSVFTTRLYTDVVEAADGSLVRRPVWAIAPESILVSPAPGAVLARGQPTEVWGWAWSFRPVRQVEVSLDEGASYRPASLEPRRGWTWQRFSFLWRPDAPGRTELRVRATDEAGETQPVEGARNALHRVEVTVQ